MVVLTALFVAAGRTYQISRHCLQHFYNYFYFSSFLLILKGLLQKIFSALLATSEENREQTIIFRLIGRESSERIIREKQGENQGISETYSLTLKIIINTRSLPGKQRMSSVH